MLRSSTAPNAITRPPASQPSPAAPQLRWPLPTSTSAARDDLAKIAPTRLTGMGRSGDAALPLRARARTARPLAAHQSGAPRWAVILAAVTAFLVLAAGRRARAADEP